MGTAAGEDKKVNRKFKDIARSFKFLYGEAWAYDKRYVLLIPVYVLVNVFASFPLVFIPALGVKYLGESKNFTLFIVYTVILFVITLLLMTIDQYLTSYIRWSNTFVRIKRLSYLDYKKALELDYDFYETKELKEKKSKAEAALMSNWNGAELFMKQIPALSICFIGMIVYAVTSAVVSPWMVVLFLVASLATMILGAIGGDWYEKYAQKRNVEYSKLQYIYRTSKDANKGKDIRNYRLAKMFHIFMNKKFTLYERYAVIQRYLIILPNVSNTICGFIKDIVAYSLMIPSVIRGDMSASDFALIASVLNGISTYMSDMGMKFSDLIVASEETGLFMDYLDETSKFNHGEGVDVSSLQLPLDIEFKDVSFTYPGAEKPTISHLSFKISGGQKVALVGENGAGKTTIIKLLSGFYKPTEGQVLVGGHDILDFNIDEYRTLLSVINQEVHLAGLKVKQVVGCELEPDETKIWNVLDQAGMSEKIHELKHGIDTYITQNLDNEGVEFSGGQMQKLMLARALYKDGAILLLDEPTSALDPIAEGDLYNKYASLTQGKTSLFISHRLSSTRFCDDIIYLENGNIVERGTHDELMNKNGEYAKIFNIQAHYYREGE